MKGIGKESGGLHIFKKGLRVGVKNNEKAKEVIVAGVSMKDCSLWHRRLGHPSVKTLKSLQLLQNNASDECLNKCTVCPLAK